MLGGGLALSGCGSTKTVRINNGSMEPTFHVGAQIVFNTEKSTPKVGQVVLFHPPQGASEKEYNPMCGPAPHPSPRGGGAACSAPVATPANEKFVKRIVAGPGDVISIREGHVTLNGHREPDSYTKPCGKSAECDFPTPIKIPPDHWFAMNDNRGESNDSRSWGPIPTSWIIGHLT
jgi:signal peptidase I